MGLFSKKTDKEIIAEGRSLYIKGNLSGANLKLIKIAMKGNDEACYWVGRIYLEEADKTRNEKRREQGKFYLEKSAKLGNKDACALLAKAFGVPNPYAVVEDKAEAEARAKAEAEARAKAEAEARAKSEEEARAKAEEAARITMSNKINSLEIKEGMVYKCFNNFYECVYHTIFSEVSSRMPTKIRVMAKKLSSGKMVEMIFLPSEYVEQVEFLERKLMFSYDDGKNLCFLDSDTYHTIEVSKTNFKWEQYFLTTNLDVSCWIFENEIIKIVLPYEVCLTINSCDTIDSSKSVKSAICETGLKVNVPLFINPGERICVSTFDGSYKGRVR